MQLKRNKEMEFETLKKSHKKEIIIGALAICVIGGALTFDLTRAKYRVEGSIDLAKGTVNYKPYDFKIMAMYKSEDGSNYIETTAMLESGYIINEEKTYCTTDNKTQVKGKIKTENNKHYITGLSKSDKCYLYFDKKASVDNANELLAKVRSEAKIATPNFASTATTNEGVYAVSDGMYGGTSYYWRGAVTTNYLKFAGFCWRIVRINGDGSIRMIYDGTTCHANGIVNTESLIKTNITYNESDNRSEYVGWTYSFGSQRTIVGTSSNAKMQLETWYNENITEMNLSKIDNGKFCNDRNTTSEYSWSSQPSSTFYYAAKTRLYTDYAPTLNCSSGDVYQLNIGLITADEVMFAGGKDEINTSYYLHNGQSYWTITPYQWTSSSGYGHAWLLHVSSNGYLGNTVATASYGLRPVINLRSDVTFSGGDGTLNNPYIVQ